MVVRARPVNRDEQPEAFRDLRGIEFFTEVKGPASHTLLGQADTNERPFLDRIDSLGGELVQQLCRQRPKAGAYDQTVPTSSACVFVARATKGLEKREEALRSYLRQEGLEVLPSPQSRYPETSLEAYEAAMLRELESSCLFAQLLSGTRGRELPFAPGKRLPALQYELARRAQKPIMQWRAREQAVDTKDSEHRALLEGAQACGIEEFKRAVCERALRPPPPRPPPLPDPRLTVSIFVDADTRDNGLASQVVKALRDLGASCSGPPNTDIQETLKTAVQECHGIVLVYGRAGFPWLLARSCKLVRLGTEVARLPTLAVFEGPPSEKPEVPLTAPGLEIIDCRNGIDLDKLRQFVALLRK